MYLATVFHKGLNICNFLFAFLRSNSLLKGVYSIRKEFAPSGSKFFPYSVDPYLEGTKNILT